VGNAQQRRLDVVLFVEVGNADHCDVQLFGQVLERRENAAHVGCRAAVHLTDTEIGAHRVDDHEPDVADLLDLLPQELEVGNESRASSSALNQITLPCGAMPSSHGSSAPAVTAAAMKAAICPLPMSGKPAINPILPKAKRSGHSQSTPRISRPAALLITSLSSRCALPLGTSFSSIRSMSSPVSLSTELSPLGNERGRLLP